MPTNTVKRFQLIYSFEDCPNFDLAKNYMDYELEELFRLALTQQIRDGKSLHQFSVQLLRDPINWRQEAESYAQEILNDLDLENLESLKVLIQQTDDEAEIFGQLEQTLDLYSLVWEKVEYRFAYSTQDAIECLENRNLGWYDEDDGIATTKTTWQFLQQRATFALEKAVNENLEELIKAKISQLILIEKENN